MSNPSNPAILACQYPFFHVRPERVISLLFPKEKMRPCEQVQLLGSRVQLPVPPTVHLLRCTAKRFSHGHTHRLLLIVQNYIWLQRSDSHPHLSCIVASTSHLLFLRPLVFSPPHPSRPHGPQYALVCSFCLKSHFPFIIFVSAKCDSVGHTRLLCPTFQSSKSPTPELVEARIDCNFQTQG